VSQLLRGTVAPEIEGPGDAELISAVRGGDLEAYGQLFERHMGAARRLARQLVSSGDVDDLVSEAFAKVLTVLQRGGGPDLAFRAYLLTSVRRLHVDRLRAGSRLTTTDDLEAYDKGEPFRDTVVEGFESGAAARAFASLPERWQMVLWHTEVEGQKPADVAPLLGMTANSVAALAYRAREGLRQAFISMHAQEADEDACITTQRNLGTYIRGGMSRRESAKVEGHLADCRRCMGVYLELTEVNSDLRGILAPLVLGGAAAGYLGSIGGLGLLAVVKGGALFAAGRVRDLVVANAPASAVAGVAATAAVATGVVIVATPDEPQGRADRPAVLSPQPTPSGDRTGATSGSDGRHPGGKHGGRRGGGAAGPAGQPGFEGVSSPQDGGSPFVEVPLEFETPSPTDEPSETPSQTPTETPTPEPTAEPTEPGSETPTPTPTPTEEPGDVSVAARATPVAGLAWQVSANIAGVPEGARVTVTVRTSSPTIALTLDPRCLGIGLGDAQCHLSGPGSLDFLAVPLPGQGGSITFTVDYADGSGTDPDPSDNTSTVQLGP
jgi:RNA polymerase sigma factor (sigma-70 family)